MRLGATFGRRSPGRRRQVATLTPSDRIRYEACMVVDEKTKVKGEVELRDLDAGDTRLVLRGAREVGRDRVLQRVRKRSTIDLT